MVKDGDKERERKGRKEKVRLSKELPSSSLDVQEENDLSCFSAFLFIMVSEGTVNKTGL